MDTNKDKEALSIKEIESFTKKHRFEVFFALAFILAALFSWVFFGSKLTIIIAAIGGILGVIFPGKIEHFSKKMFHFIFKQEKTIQLILGIVGLTLSIFLPFLTFFLLGLHGGKSCYHQAMEVYSRDKG